MESEGLEFLYEPSNEIETVMLFGRLMPYLTESFSQLGYSGSPIRIVEYPDTFPDCTLRCGDEEIKAEFQFYGSDFKADGHDPSKCDLLVCWKNDWEGHPSSLKVLELAPLVTKLRAEKGLEIIAKHESLHPERRARWTLEEFSNSLGKNVSAEDFRKLSSFIEELRHKDNIEFQQGKGRRYPTLGIAVGRPAGNFPLSIESSGKALIAYRNVNDPRQPWIIQEEKARRIATLLGGESKKWHYIKATNMDELIRKLRETIRILES